MAFQVVGRWVTWILRFISRENGRWICPEIDLFICLIYSACGPFHQVVATLFTWFFVCWLSVPLFTPLAYFRMISTFWLYLTILLLTLVSIENALKRSVRFKRAPFSLPGLSPIVLGGLTSDHGTNSALTIKMIPAISEPIWHTLLMAKIKSVLTRTFVKLPPGKTSWRIRAYWKLHFYNNKRL